MDSWPTVYDGASRLQDKGGRTSTPPTTHHAFTRAPDLSHAKQGREGGMHRPQMQTIVSLDVALSHFHSSQLELGQRAANDHYHAGDDSQSSDHTTTRRWEAGETAAPMCGTHNVAHAAQLLGTHHRTYNRSDGERSDQHHLLTK